MKNKLVIANWKMNGSVELIRAYNDLLSTSNVLYDLIIATPHVYLDYAKKIIDSKAIIASQDVHSHFDGAYTGGVSARMIKDIGVNWSIIGHSETRSLGCNITTKMLSAIESSINIIWCIGDNSNDLVSNRRYIEAVFRDEFAQVYHKLKERGLQLYVAYEPIWSIGTGVVADVTYIENVSKIINDCCLMTFGGKVDVIYGGSVNDKNFSDILNLNCISGLLIGGASLNISSVKNILTL